MDIKNFRFHHLYHTSKFFALSFIVFLFACSDDDEINPNNDPGNPNGGNIHQEVNNWIYANMGYYYLWNDKIPENPDFNQSPEPFFSSLLNTFDPSSNPEGDRFSWISEDAGELEAALSGVTKSTGMEFRLFFRDNSNQQIAGQVLYVQKGSPAEEAGFKRGDIFTKVNGMALTAANYRNLLFGDNSLNVTLGSLDQEDNIQDSNQILEVVPVQFQENPVFLDTVFQFDGQKVGYFVYNQFVPGPFQSQSNEYDQALDEIFARFKNAGVTDLIVDFRYNGGGYGSSAINLASLIGRNVDDSKVFARDEFNEKLTADLKERFGEEFFIDNFKNKAENIGNQLNQVVFLVSGWTASASELVINGLLPYMPVKLIGARTQGKNVGSITIKDEDGDIRYGLQPIVLKAYNSLGESDYTNGFSPDKLVSEPLRLHELGDVREALLNEALLEIGTPVLRVGKPTIDVVNQIGSSIERKPLHQRNIYSIDRVRVK